MHFFPPITHILLSTTNAWFTVCTRVRSRALRRSTEEMIGLAPPPLGTCRRRRGESLYFEEEAHLERFGEDRPDTDGAASAFGFSNFWAVYPFSPQFVRHHIKGAVVRHRHGRSEGWRRSWEGVRGPADMVEGLRIWLEPRHFIGGPAAVLVIGQMKRVCWAADGADHDPGGHQRKGIAVEGAKAHGDGQSRHRRRRRREYWGGIWRRRHGQQDWQMSKGMDGPTGETGQEAQQQVDLLLTHSHPRGDKANQLIN